MGYFDALTNASFKTKADGQRLFYPYGILGVGYIIPSEEEFDQLRHTMKIMWIVAPLLVLVTFWQPIVVFPVVAVMIIAYLLWARLRCRNFARSSEKLTYTESIANEARGLSTGILWFFEFFSILFIFISLLFLVINPRNWLTGSALLILFIFSSVSLARMIRIKHRQAASK